MKVIGVKFTKSKKTQTGIAVWASETHYYLTPYIVSVGEFVYVQHPDTNQIVIAIVYEDNAQVHPDRIQRGRAYTEDAYLAKMKVEELKTLMDERLDHLQRQKLYEQFAKEDNLLAELLIEYRSLLEKYKLD